MPDAIQDFLDGKIGLFDQMVTWSQELNAEQIKSSAHTPERIAHQRLVRLMAASYNRLYPDAPELQVVVPRRADPKRRRK